MYVFIHIDVCICMYLCRLMYIHVCIDIDRRHVPSQGPVLTNIHVCSLKKNIHINKKPYMSKHTCKPMTGVRAHGCTHGAEPQQDRARAHAFSGPRSPRRGLLSCLAMHCTCMNAKHSALVFVLVIISIVLVLVLVIISISIAMHCTCMNAKHSALVLVLVLVIISIGISISIAMHCTCMKAKHSACVPNVTLACRVCVRKTPASLLRGTNIL
jgi:hypothetical protein